jgi:hypothetical protein
MAGEADPLALLKGDLTADNSQLQNGQKAKLAFHRLAI